MLLAGIQNSFVMSTEWRNL